MEKLFKFMAWRKKKEWETFNYKGNCNSVDKKKQSNELDNG